MAATCGKQVRNYLYGTTIVAVMILIASYWYLGTTSPEKGLEARFAQAPGLSAAPAGAGQAVAQPVAAVRTGKRSPAAAVVAALQSSVVNISAVRLDEQPLLNGQGQTETAPAKKNGSAFRFAEPMAGVSTRSIGSGVIVTEDGYILTNYHVVQQSDQIYVTVFGDRGSARYPADVVHLDERVDLALLKIEPKASLQPVALGNSETLNIGDQVLAMGSPFGLEQSVSQGIVSGKRESLIIEGVPHRNLLQTDAAINQGNSGGPLVNMEGYVVGVNTAIYTPTGAFAGVGFAVPARTVREFLDELITLPQVQANVRTGLTGNGAAWNNAAAAPPPIAPDATAAHGDRGPCQFCHQIMVGPGVAAQGGGSAAGMNAAQAIPSSAAQAAGYPVLFGAAVRPVDQVIANHFNHPENSGVFICNVIPGSCAAQAGLQAGDIVVKCDGKPCVSPQDLLSQLAAAGQSNQQVRLSLVRNGGRAECRLRINSQGGSMNSSMLPVGQVQTAAANPPPLPAATAVPNEFEWLGMELIPANPTIAGGAAVTEGQGAIVKEVGVSSRAELAGVQANDVVVAINKIPVDSAATLNSIINSISPMDGVLLEIDRASQRLYLTM